MATVDTTYLRQKSLPKLEVGSNFRSMLKNVRGNVEGFIEYTGSFKSVNGEGGWWRLEEWASHRIDQALKKRGERV